ncbi:MAG: 3-dehydroquinate dehydratase [Frankiales bacterium]|nr:3-dehydroquinate dehydratase [Frankiales bacterium]
MSFAERGGPAPDEDLAAVVATTAVTAALADYYAAVHEGDIDGLGRAYDDERPDQVCLVLPGLRPVHGRSSVLRAWSAIIAQTSALQIHLSDQRIDVDGDVAVVSTVEDMITTGEAYDGVAALSQTFVLRRRPDGWRIVHQHASPLLNTAEPRPQGPL